MIDSLKQPKINLLILVSFIVFQLHVFSQKEHVIEYQTSDIFSKKEMKKFHRFGINMKTIDFTDRQNITNLNLILKHDHKKSVNKGFAYFYTGSALVEIVLGSALKAKGGLGDLFGNLFLATGVTSGIISIPFWIGQSKQKKKRDQLIKLF